jgi:uncharacterized Fe-S center protein
MASKVYYMDPRSRSPQTSLVAKMATVFEAAGFDSLIKPKDVVAIKLHCGEWNNSAYLRPVYARTLADRVKALGGRPFVCDTTTMPYQPYASRATGLDLVATAERNGYNSATLGCPFICADGYLGTDDYRVDIPEGYILKEAYIAQAIASADVLITLTHFKGHGAGVFGGAMKNLGIGAQSKRGKFNVHLGGHPKYSWADSAIFHPENCKGRKGEKDWEVLEQICPWELIHVTEDSIEIEFEKCPDCKACMGPMSARGIVELTLENGTGLNAAIADACLGTIKAVGEGKVAFINMAIDCSPRCDCVSYADVPIVPHLGVFAGYDPVALDKACLDKARDTAGAYGSSAEDMEALEVGCLKFESCSPVLSGLSEAIQVNTGELNGMGTRNYEIVEVPERPVKEFLFPLDSRPAGLRLKKMWAQKSPFPFECYEGKGFNRKEEVDLERVNTHYESFEKLTETGGD